MNAPWRSTWENRRSTCALHPSWPHDNPVTPSVVVQAGRSQSVRTRRTALFRAHHCPSAVAGRSQAPDHTTRSSHRNNVRKPVGCGRISATGPPPTCKSWPRTLPDPLAALRAWRGLLVEDGRVGVSTFGSYDERWRQEVDAALARHAPPELADARTSGARGPFASDERMEDLLGQAGFRHVHTVNTVVKARFDDPEHWYRWSMSVGQRQFWLAIPEHQLPEVKAEVLAAVDRCRDETGIVGFDQTVRYTLAVR
jgi:hypothetical protein